MNFAKVDNDNMTVNEVLPYSAGMNKGNSSTGDQIQIPDPITGLYTSYYLSDGNFSGRTGTVYYPERDGKWFKGTATTPATDVMKPGTTFWYISTKFDTAYPITVAGAVATDATKSFEINKTYTLIANPYPTALKLNGVAGETFVGRQDGMKSGNSSSGDQIQIPDPITGLYASYYLSDGNFSGRTGTVYYPERDGKWFKGTATTETTDSIPAGMGGWYIRMGTATFDITVENPVK